MKTKVCGSCGYTGKPVHDEYASLLIDVFAWAVAFTLAAITGVIYLAVLGPLVSVWHLFTFRSHRCPRCGAWQMHSANDQHYHA